MVRTDLQLEAVRRTPFRRSHNAGVVDQYIDVALPGVCERVYRCQVSEIKAANFALAGDGLCNRLSFSHVADREHDPSTGFRERPRGWQPDATIGTSDDKDASSL